MNLEGLTAAAFLDRFERFTKRVEDIATVRLWFADDSPAGYTELTYADFQALTLEEQTTINETGSGAGLVITEGKSNA